MYPRQFCRQALQSLATHQLPHALLPIASNFQETESKQNGDNIAIVKID
jgi:hypothetical protein